MSEHDSRLGVPGIVDTRSEPDRDIRFKWVFVAGGAIVVVTLLYAILMWPFAQRVFDRVRRSDPPASPITEAAERALPPAPRLQPDPPKEIGELRQWERRILTTYGWVDRQTGIARIPLARAEELILEEGLPEVPNPPPSTSTPKSAEGQ